MSKGVSEKKLFEMEWSNRQQMANDIKQSVWRTLRKELKNYYVLFYTRFCSVFYELFSFCLSSLLSRSSSLLSLYSLIFFFALPCFCFMYVYNDNKRTTYNYSTSAIEYYACMHVCIYVWFPKIQCMPLCLCVWGACEHISM